MEETPLKRPREEEEEEAECFKRQKPYKDILSILDEDEDEPYHDFSSLITTLQQEISSPTAINDQPQLISTCSSDIDPCSLFEYASVSPSYQQDEGAEETERVMRHLLEASDDELGIPNTEDATVVNDGFDGWEIDGGDLLLPMACDGLWEIEDEAANYYALLQSQLFM